MKKKPFKPFRCAECGDVVDLATGPGRRSEYRRGVILAVPEDFAIPTCVGCGEQHLTAEMGQALSELQAPDFAAWQRRTCKPLVEKIQRDHDAKLADVERACGVSRTYLSHVVNGSKEASLTLIRLLEAFARHPDEFRRHHAPRNGAGRGERAAPARPKKVRRRTTAEV